MTFDGVQAKFFEWRSGQIYLHLHGGQAIFICMAARPQFIFMFRRSGQTLLSMNYNLILAYN